MIEMMLKRFSVLPVLCALAALPTPMGAERAGLAQVQRVYLLSMGNGLDQYLANRLTAEGVFQVVIDPKKADAVLTDQLGAGFERRFDELFRQEEPPPTAAAAEGSDAKKGSAEPKKETDAEMSERLKRGNQTPISSFSRGKGNVFLVDVKSRQVLWSLYERTKKIMPDELDRTSRRIVQQLKKDLSGKP